MPLYLVTSGYMIELVSIDLHADPTDQRYASLECQSLITQMHAFYDRVGFHPPWVGYFAIEAGTVVGTGGFAGVPRDGRVEVAYWTFKDHEGRGIATQVCRILVELVMREDNSLEIIAKTAPERNASTIVLEKNGFKYKEVVQDHEIGDAWL